MSEWNSVKDKLPEYKSFYAVKTSGPVLVTNGRAVKIAEYNEYPAAKTEKGRNPRWTSPGYYGWLGRLWLICLF